MQGIEVVCNSSDLEHHHHLNNPHNDDSLRTDGIRKKLYQSDILNSIRASLIGQNCYEVTSPTIVGKIANGPVPTFKVNHLGRELNLTVSNLLFHQILLSQDYPSIFEFSKNFRANDANTSQHTHEIRMLDVHLPYSTLEDGLDIARGILRSSGAIKTDQDYAVMSFTELKKYLVKKGYREEELTAPSALRKNKGVKKHLPSLVFITHTPSEQKYFFLKEQNGICQDFEVRITGGRQLLSGGVRETDISKVISNIEEGGGTVSDYSIYIDALKKGIPPNVGFSVGLDRLFGYILNEDNIKNISHFPQVDYDD